MNEIVQGSVHLPDTIEDLTQFVLVGKARLNAYMLKIQNVNSLSVAQEIRDQTLHEAQELQGALFAAEQKIGEILLAIPKQSANQYTSANSTGNEKAKSKTETISEMGYSKDEVSRYQQMAKNPDVVQKVLDDSVANGAIASISQLNKALKENNQLKRELADRDRRIKELETRKPEVKEVIKEVVPDDVKEQLEESRQLSERRYKDMKSAQKRADEAEAKLRAIEATQADINGKATKEAEYFEVAVYDFIKRCGGYVWLCERINDMPDDVARRFKKALFQIEAMAKTMIEQTGGYAIEE